MNRYEALLILNSDATDDKIQDIIERLEKDFAKDGAKIEQVQRMERRNFSYAAGELRSGYYVNFIFESDPSVIDKLLARFKLDTEVYRQHIQRLAAKKA
jgi:small subunit ribosomal protein S6